MNITKRELFAKSSHSVLLANWLVIPGAQTAEAVKICANNAVVHADALLEALGERQESTAEPKWFHLDREAPKVAERCLVWRVPEHSPTHRPWMELATWSANEGSFIDASGYSRSAHQPHSAIVFWRSLPDPPGTPEASP